MNFRLELRASYLTRAVVFGLAMLLFAWPAKRFIFDYIDTVRGGIYGTDISRSNR